MTDLIQRVEAAKKPSVELFLEVGRLLMPDRQGRNENGARWALYCTMLDAQAWTSAAEMLVPEGWNWMAGERNPGKCRAYVENNQPAFVGFGNKRNPDRVWHEVVAAHPSLALLAAIMRAERKDDE